MPTPAYPRPARISKTCSSRWSRKPLVTYPGRIQEVYRFHPIKRIRMERRAERSSGFAATLRAAAGFEAPETVLPLLDLALRESGAVRKEALRHLLSLRGSSAAEIVVRGFSLLDATERVEAMRDRE